MAELAGTALPSMARAIRWNVSGQAALVAVGFFTSIATARILGPADRGVLGVLLTAASLAVALSAAGIPIAVGFYASKEDADEAALTGNALVIAALLGSAFIGGAWAARASLAQAFTHGRAETLWVLAAALVPLTFLDWVLGNHLLGRFGFRRYNTAAVAAKLAVLFVTVSLAGLLGLGLRGCMVAAIVGEIVVITGMAVAVVKRRPRVNARLLRSMLAYGVRVQIGAVFQLMNYRLDVLILSLFRPLRQVGYYVIAEAMAELVLAVGRAFQSALMPIVARSETDRDRAAASIAGSRGHAIAALFAIAGTAVAGPGVIYFGYGARFAPAIVPTLILLPAMWFLGSGNVVSADLRGRGRPGLSSALSGAAVVATVVLDLVLIPPFGMIGAAIASVIAYTTFGCLSLVVLSALSGCSIATLCIPSRREFRAVARLIQHPRALRGT